MLEHHLYMIKTRVVVKSQLNDPVGALKQCVCNLFFNISFVKKKVK